MKGKRPLRVRLGLYGYGRVLARIAKSPATFQDLIDAGLIGNHGNGYMLLGSLHKLQRIHIKEWLEIPGCTLRALWAYGSGDDAPIPSHRAGGKRRVVGAFIPAVKAVPPYMLAFDALLNELESPRTVAQLSERTELDPETIRRALEGIKPLVRAVGRKHAATQWQLREATSGQSRHALIGKGIGQVCSVFHLGAVANEERRAA